MIEVSIIRWVFELFAEIIGPIIKEPIRFIEMIVEWFAEELIWWGMFEWSIVGVVAFGIGVAIYSMIQSRNN